jgi:hypothetical protein
MSDWQDERPPEQVLGASAARSRYLSPWDMLNQPEDESEAQAPFHAMGNKGLARLTAWVSTTPIQKAIEGVSRWRQKWTDTRLSREERHRRDENEGPSPRAFQEFLSYYTGLYQTRGPDPLRFSRLLTRNGLPDWVNPYPESAAEHYEFHPQGLLAADVDYLLQAIEEDWAGKENERPVPPAFPDSVMATGQSRLSAPAGHTARQWPSLYGADAGRESDRLREHVLWRAEARKCWALAIVAAYRQQVEGSIPFAHLLREVHPDNLWLVTVDAYQNLPEGSADASPAFVSRADFLEAATALGFGLSLDMNGVDVDRAGPDKSGPDDFGPDGSGTGSIAMPQLSPAFPA